MVGQRRRDNGMVVVGIAVLVAVLLFGSWGVLALTGGQDQEDPWASADGPIATMPDEERVYVQVAEDPIYHGVEVQFRGGPGHILVKTIHAAVVHEDGMWFEKRLSLPAVGDQITLPGTRNPDRVIVIADYTDGSHRKLYDAVL